MVDKIAYACARPLILARLPGTLKFRRVLVVIEGQDELERLLPIVSAVGQFDQQDIQQELKILSLMPHGDQAQDCARLTQALNTAATSMGLSERAVCKVVPAESPIQTALEETRECDLVMMSIDDHGTEHDPISVALAYEMAESLVDRSILLARGDLRLQASERPNSENRV
jgi:hypothetical protein